MDLGKQKYEEEMDIVNIIMNIRKHQVAIKSNILCCDEKDYLAEHAQQNIIHFDTTSEEEAPEPAGSEEEIEEEEEVEVDPDDPDK